MLLELRRKTKTERWKWRTLHKLGITINGDGYPFLELILTSYIKETYLSFQELRVPSLSLSLSFFPLCFLSPYQKSLASSQGFANSNQLPFPFPSILFVSRENSLSKNPIDLTPKSYGIPFLFFSLSLSLSSVFLQEQGLVYFIQSLVLYIEINNRGLIWDFLGSHGSLIKKENKLLKAKVVYDRLFLKLWQLLVSSCSCSCSWWLFTEISVTPLEPEDEEQGAARFKSVLRNWWKTGVQIFFFSSLFFVFFFKNIRHKTQLWFCIKPNNQTKISLVFQFQMGFWVQFNSRQGKLTKVGSSPLMAEGGASESPTRRYSCITQSVLKPLGGFPV